MELSLVVLTQVLIMFTVMLIGGICYKAKLVNEEGSKQLADITLLVVTPALIITSYQVEFNTALLNSLLIAIALAVVSHTVGIIISKLLIVKKNNENIGIESFAVTFANSGYMGIPLIYAVFGTKGVFLASAYISVFNIIMWSYGVSTMTEKKPLKERLIKLINPVIISVLVGLPMFFFSIKLPYVLAKAFSAISELNMPMAMIVAGIYIAKSNILEAFKNFKIYYISFLRLMVVPAIMLVILKVFKISDDVLLINLIATACPSAAATIMFATMFNKNTIHAAQIFVVSTIFSIITIPMWVFIANII